MMLQPITKKLKAKEMKTKFMTLLALAAFVTVPAMAGENSPEISYAAKKQGRVAFQTQKTKESATTIDYSNPANIEPAAGGFEPEEKTERSSLSDSMRLPRK